MNLILIDTHSHFHNKFEADIFFNCAWNNFARVFMDKGSDKNPGNGVFILLLLFQSGVNISKRLTEILINSHEWQIQGETGDSFFKLESNQGKVLFIAGGYQLISREKIELLQLFPVEFASENIPAAEMADSLIKNDQIVIIPWGFGKWTGKRGKIVKKIFENKQVLAADTLNRGTLWPYPKLLKFAQARNHNILIGTDPLPLKSEVHKTGLSGIYLFDEFDFENPAAYLKKIFKKKPPVYKIYSKNISMFRFIFVQVYMQIRKIAGLK